MIPDSITMIESGVFKECSGLNGTLTLSDNLTEIGGDAFKNCGFTGDLVIPDSVKSIGTYAFYSCDRFDGNLVLPENLNNIGI